MSIETFVVTFHEGYWQISFEGQWYGTYPDRESAVRVAVGIAKEGANCQRELLCSNLIAQRQLPGSRPIPE